MCIELIFTKEEGNIIKIRMTLYLEEKSSTTPPPQKKKFVCGEYNKHSDSIAIHVPNGHSILNCYIGLEKIGRSF